ncbi:DUF2934 domain-containing protein [Microvirga roseola]|uniref:DUF2934 domain-containing protein n=1 Tax=Microvirga roseola TaxID=2883126 RepID=UPI001E5746F5|nr:DUF2934 domain-containing protein [Microvirga roseola]
MDKDLEQKIRDRAYELWMQNGCLPGRDEEYWLQAEHELRGQSDVQTESDVGGGTASDVGSYPLQEGQESGAQAPVDMGPEVIPGATGEATETTETQATPEETAPAPAAKQRRKRSTAAKPEESGEPATTTGGATKRRRTTRTSS